MPQARSLPGREHTVPVAPRTMAVTLKCAACGAEVVFEELNSKAEKTCPGCQVKVRYRECDEQMAIPVSMTLPEEFAPIDLSSVADKSALLVERYKKPAAESAESAESDTTDVTLARALKALADSVGVLDERLNRHEGKAPLPPEEESTDHKKKWEESVEVSTSEERVDGYVRSNRESISGVVHLDPQEREGSKEQTKANPVEARVLVRREAAQIAHNFQRERNGQKDWTEEASSLRHGTGGSGLIRSFPKTTVLVAVIGVALLSVAVILWTGTFLARGEKVGEELTLASPQTTGLSQLMEDDPEAAMAETVARGYLNATSAQAALPFVWQSEIIRNKFERYFKPLSQPDAYELTLQDRATGKGGRPQFLYRIDSPGEKGRRLLLLPEGSMPKVFWEFFAEVGDMPWSDFLSSQPEAPVEMRVWLHPTDLYISGYDSEKWQSYILHDRAEQHRILAYAPRDLGDDWKISDALRNRPVTFKRHEAVMALLLLRHKREVDTQGFSGAIVEIEDVVSTSWLPDRFRAAKN